LNRERKEERNIFLWIHLPVWLYMIGIFILSSIPSLRPPDLGFEPQDKLYHLVFYIPFGYLVARSVSVQNLFPSLKKRYWIYGILFGILYGISDEMHQYFVPGRIMSVWDMVADSLGVSLGVLLFHHRNRLLKYMHRNADGMTG